LGSGALDAPVQQRFGAKHGVARQRVERTFEAAEHN
jgi:hypothetical protein